MPYYNRDPKQDHNSDNHPPVCASSIYVGRDDSTGCQGIMSRLKFQGNRFRVRVRVWMRVPGLGFTDGCLRRRV